MNKTTQTKRERANATKRLYAFLAEVERSNPNLQVPVLDIMAAALGIDGKTADADCSVMENAVDLLRRSEREIRAYLPDELDFYLRSFEPLYRFFGPRSCMQIWHQTRGNLREKFIVDIENTAVRLTGLVPELSLLDADFEDVRRAMSAFWTSLEEAELSDEVRSALTMHFKELQCSIDHYVRVGAPGIRESFERVTGMMVTDGQVRSRLASDHKRGGGVLNAILRVGVATLWLLTTANTVHDAQKNFAPFVERLMLDEPAASHQPPSSHLPDDRLLVADVDVQGSLGEQDK